MALVIPSDFQCTMWIMFQISIPFIKPAWSAEPPGAIHLRNALSITRSSLFDELEVPLLPTLKSPSLPLKSSSSSSSKLSYFCFPCYSRVLKYLKILGGWAKDGLYSRKYYIYIRSDLNILNCNHVYIKASFMH